MLGKAVMDRKSPLERLAATRPECEIWWDSSPLVFENWKGQALAEQSLARREIVETWHGRYYSPEQPGKQLFRGACADLARTFAGLQQERWFWREWVVEQKRRNRREDAHALWWRLYLELLRRGAEKYLHVFHDSGLRYGYFSAPVDPRAGNNEAALKKQAAQIASTASNLIAAVPATPRGIDAIRYLTARGIGTNATMCFSLGQFAAVAAAVQGGLLQARSRRVDLSTWRCLVTASAAEFEEQGGFEQEGARIGLRLNETERRWASIAILKKAIRHLRERDFPGKLMIDSIRSGPVVEGRRRLWHMEKIAGADVIYACPGWLVQEMEESAEELSFEPGAWQEPVPEDVLSKLKRFACFRKAYELRRSALTDSGAHPALRWAVADACRQAEEMEHFVVEAIAAFPSAGPA